MQLTLLCFCVTDREVELLHLRKEIEAQEARHISLVNTVKELAVSDIFNKANFKKKKNRIKKKKKVGSYIYHFIGRNICINLSVKICQLFLC